MNHCSYFIKDKCLFGAYPTQSSVTELEENGIRFFINLTFSHETKIVPYTTNYIKIDYPIPDRSIPENTISFSKFILYLCSIIKSLKNNDKIYIHCKGGQSRSPMVASSLLCYLFNMTAHEAISYIGKCHKNRSILKEKWRKSGIPMTYTQKKFVHKLFNPISYNKIYKSSSKCFTFLSIPVYIHEIDTKFLSITDAFDYYKKTFETDSQNIIFQNFVNEHVNSWDKIKENIIENLIELSFSQNEELKSNLLHSYLRPIIVQLHKDTVWGIGTEHHKGQNKLGKILTRIRLKFLHAYEN